MGLSVLATPMPLSPNLFLFLRDVWIRTQRARYQLSQLSPFNFSARVAGRHLSILANKRGAEGRGQKCGFHSATFSYIFLAGKSVLANPLLMSPIFVFLRNVWIRTQRAVVTSRLAIPT